MNARSAKNSLFIVALVFATSCVASNAQQFNPRRLLAPQPPIEDAPFRTASDVQDDINPSELVLAVTIGDQSRAYPINMLTGPEREIINDSIGDTAFAATW